LFILILNSCVFNFDEFCVSCKMLNKFCEIHLKGKFGWIWIECELLVFMLKYDVWSLLGMWNWDLYWECWIDVSVLFYKALKCKFFI